MNKPDIERLNAVPEGKPPWLSYEHYTKLGQLFDQLDTPERGIIDVNYATLHAFLTTIVALKLPVTTEAIHFNAFVLLRRGYKVEEITDNEYADLIRLMNGLEQPAKDDPDLYEMGGHRELYNYLTRQMGLSVEAGRGPVWSRAQALIEAFREKQTTMA